MRLGTCLALELAIAVSSVTGVYLGVAWVGRHASDYFVAREAAAAPTSSPPAAVLGVAPPPEPVLVIARPVVPPPPPPPTTVFPGTDAELLAPIADAPLAKVKVNRGGTSLSLRLEFANGARAAFKPTQKAPQSDPRRELAAYRVDRLLGIGHVQPAKAGAFTVEQLVAAAEPSMKWYVQQRLDDDAIAPKGVVRGSMSWWIPEIKDGRIGGVHLDDPEGIATWGAYLKVGAKVPAEMRPLLAQISTCVLFDVVIDNADRWSGTNTKVSPDGATLYFMDNTLSFSIYTLGHATNLGPLHRVQVFSKSLVGKLRAMTKEQLEKAIDAGGDDAGLAPLLSQDEIKAVLARRDHALKYIDNLVEEFGEDKVLALP